MKRLKAQERPSEQLTLGFDSNRTAVTPRGGSPQSLRRIAIGDDIIEYSLQRVRRRTIGFHVDTHGLTVRAPHWAALRDIEGAIAENQHWIRTKRIEWRNWRERQCPVVTRLADGGEVQFLGQRVTLRLVPAEDAGSACADSAANVDANEIRLAISIAPHAATEMHVRAALQSRLQAQARVIFAQRLERFDGRISPRFAGWRLSSARTQWGSCSHNGRIRLNWRLVHFSMPVIDYVIAHELAHLRELNHSARFWQALAQLLPEFQAARDQIKRVDISAISF